MHCSRISKAGLGFVRRTISQIPSGMPGHNSRERCCPLVRESTSVLQVPIRLPTDFSKLIENADKVGGHASWNATYCNQRLAQMLEACSMTCQPQIQVIILRAGNCLAPPTNFQQQAGRIKRRRRTDGLGQGENDWIGMSRRRALERRGSEPDHL